LFVYNEKSIEERLFSTIAYHSKLFWTHTFIFSGWIDENFYDLYRNVFRFEVLSSISFTIFEKTTRYGFVLRWPIQNANKCGTTTLRGDFGSTHAPPTLHYFKYFSITYLFYPIYNLVFIAYLHTHIWQRFT